MNPLFYVLIMAIMASVFGIIYTIKTKKFTDSSSYNSERLALQEKATSLLGEDETLLLTDLTQQVGDSLILSNKYLYYFYKEKTIQLAYHQIYKVTYLDFMCNRVDRSQAVNIRLKTSEGKIDLLQFPQAPQIAAILSEHCG